VPDTFVTSIHSVGTAGSTTRNTVGGTAAFDAAGNAADDATVHDSDVPAAGAVVPPDETVVDALSANRSRGIGRQVSEIWTPAAPAEPPVMKLMRYLR
jgi:hypothetical protein